MLIRTTSGLPPLVQHYYFGEVAFGVLSEESDELGTTEAIANVGEKADNYMQSQTK